MQKENIHLYNTPLYMYVVAKWCEGLFKVQHGGREEDLNPQSET